jgi:hypothetical protein
VLKLLRSVLLALLLSLALGLAIGTAIRLRLERPVEYLGARPQSEVTQPLG